MISGASTVQLLGVSSNTEMAWSARLQRCRSETAIQIGIRIGPRRNGIRVPKWGFLHPLDLEAPSCNLQQYCQPLVWIWPSQPFSCTSSMWRPARSSADKTSAPSEPSSSPSANRAWSRWKHVVHPTSGRDQSALRGIRSIWRVSGCVTMSFEWFRSAERGSQNICNARQMPALFRVSNRTARHTSSQGLESGLNVGGGGMQPLQQAGIGFFANARTAAHDGQRPDAVPIGGEHRHDHGPHARLQLAQ